MRTGIVKDSIVDEWWQYFLGQEDGSPAPLSLEEENEHWRIAYLENPARNDEWASIYLDWLDERYGPLFNHPRPTLEDINEELRTCFLQEARGKVQVKKVA